MAMNMRRTIGITLFSLLLNLAHVASAGTLEDARERAEQGDAVAQFVLGGMYYDGDGVAQDYKQAVKWYRLAAEQGRSDAQLTLGFVYANGHGVVKDYKESVKWYRLAAAQGDDFAQFNLGNMYILGQGVAQDDKEAAKWYRLAAEQGNASAQFNLGVMYQDGDGVPQDYIVAHMYFNIAAPSLAGEEKSRATRSRTTIAAKMTPAQIAQAQDLARQCQQSNFKKCGNFSDASLAVGGDASSQASPRVARPAATSPKELGQQSTSLQQTNPAAQSSHFRQGIIRRTGENFTAPFKIKTSAGSNYFFKLINLNSNLEQMSGFIVGGSPFETKVPQGTYELRYAAGDAWTDETDYFGPDTAYSKTVNPLVFSVENDKVRGIEVELIRQKGGNLKTTRIAKQAF